MAIAPTGPSESPASGHESGSGPSWPSERSGFFALFSVLWVHPAALFVSRALSPLGALSRERPVRLQAAVAWSEFLRADWWEVNLLRPHFRPERRHVGRFHIPP